MFKKIYLKLTLRMETFVHVVPVPLAIYFSVVTGSGSFLSNDEMVTAITGALVNAAFLIILGCIWRWFYLGKLFKEIKSIYTNPLISNEKKVQLKIRLLKYPFIEARIVVLRWLVGIISAHVIVMILIGFRPELHLTALFLFSMVAPISYIAYYFISENAIRMIFKLRKIKDIEIDIGQIPQFNSFQRIIFSMVAISIMPIIVLSYMLYGIKTGLVKMDDPTMHLLIMSILFPVPVIFVGYVVAKTFRDGIMGINDDLKQLGKGNFSIVSMPTSSDDFGLQAYNLNQIIKQLNFMYSEIKDLNINLEHKVNERTAQVNEMLDQLGKLYSDSEDKRKEIEVLAESRKKLSLVGQMAAGIVHDIKNPMATIKSLAEMLNSDSISPQRRTKNLNLIVREMDRLSDLSYEILDFSKGKLNLELKEVNLKEFITEIEQFLKIDFDYANVKCIFDIQYDGNIYIDKDRMRRVFINIAKNAMEAMYDGQKEYSLTIRSELTPFFKGGQGEFIIISFIDNGNGLPKSVEERIFEAFTTEGKNKGTGLGLYMCKWIVESHNGTLTYETKQGEGTTFFVSLPVGMHGVHPINEELRIKN